MAQPPNLEATWKPGTAVVYYGSQQEKSAQWGGGSSGHGGQEEACWGQREAQRLASTEAALLAASHLNQYLKTLVCENN